MNSDLQLPRYLPVVNFGNGWIAERPELHRPLPTALTTDGPDLAELLSRVLLAATLEFERDAELSLPVCLNALRVLDADPVEVRQLSALVGVSKEAATGMVGFLERHGFLVIEPHPAGGRHKVLRLTAKGEQARITHAKRLDRVDDRWRRRFGEQLALIDDLVTPWFIRRPGEPATVALGLCPHPDGWRASKPYAAQTERVLDDPGANLPRYPMVLHRGGYPDGS